MSIIKNGIINTRAVVNTSQITYFCTPTGTGDGLSWDTACSFRTAVSKLSSSYTTTIYLSGGMHDTNNGATGTTISTNYCRIFGINNELGSPITRMINSHATATHVLNLSGSYNSINNVSFFNSDQLSKDVIYVNITGSFNDVQRCTFLNYTGDVGGTGILADGGSLSTYIIDNQFFRLIDSGIEIANTTDIITARNRYYGGNKGTYISSALADRITIEDVNFQGLTTGIDYAAFTGTDLQLIRSSFSKCTNNAIASATYTNTWFTSITTSSRKTNTYPVNAGVSVGKDADAWAWGDIVQVIPKNTLNVPIRITGINFQGWSDAQTYKMELFYGENAGDTSVGIFEVTLGDPLSKKAVSQLLPLNLFIPANAYVGMKIKSSTAGVDSVTVCLAYDPL
jgi:hypothetical protein